MSTDFDIARFHAGDDVYFAELVRSYSPRVRSYLRGFASAAVDADDLLQELWVRAYRKRASFEGRGSFIGWLLMVARNIGLANLKPERAFPAETAITPDPVEDVERAQQQQRLRVAIDELPTRQREVVLLRIVEGKSTREAAQLLGLAEGTIKATLHQAIVNLQTRLKVKNERVSGS